MADDIKVKIVADNSELKEDLEEAENEFKIFGVGVNKIIAAIGAAFAAKKIFDFGASLVQSFSEAQDAERRLETQLKMTGEAAKQSKEQILARSAALMEMSTHDDDAITSLQAQLLIFRNISGDNFDRATKAALNLSAALGEDLATAGQKVGTALNAPETAFRTLRQAGIAFTDAQEKIIKGMVETGDIASAQNLILNELEQSFDGAAEAAAGTFSGAMAQVKNRLGNMGEEIGGKIVPILEKLMPLFEELVNIVNVVLIPAVTDALDVLAELADVILKTFNAVKDSISESVNAIKEFFRLKEEMGLGGEAPETAAPPGFKRTEFAAEGEIFQKLKDAEEAGLDELDSALELMKSQGATLEQLQDAEDSGLDQLDSALRLMEVELRALAAPKIPVNAILNDLFQHILKQPLDDALKQLTKVDGKSIAENIEGAIDQGFRASIEDLVGLNTRIATAHASVAPKEDKVVAAIDKNRQAVEEQGNRQVAAIENLNVGLT